MPSNTPLTNDELTGLLSRKAFHEALDSLLMNSKKLEAPISLAFLDIDN